MRKILLAAVAVAMLTVGIAGIAVAETFVCRVVPCEGTDEPDQIGERDGSVKDTIRAKGGGDRVDADLASMDADRVLGNAGDDLLEVGDGDFRDNVHGGPGNDTCVIDIGFGGGGESFPNLDGVRSCEEVITSGGSEQSQAGEQRAAGTEGLRPLTAEEKAAAEAAYR
jgi:hypothetical protein